ncbi:hypothetical protein RHMOL_Rhmol06G0101900 [Rhododendron molle]|uniref:Uncharacterized protein n=1 Tax=Rhododendron molle TaxID=49168 RepID=A0ACC0NCD1_RHOML|nr:hypothetical protein RHMOL_Rhmol06G0101900 [Rhododendron molle]
MSDEGKIRMLVSGFLHPSDPAFSLEIIIVITWAHKISCRGDTMGVFAGQGSSQVCFKPIWSSLPVLGKGLVKFVQFAHVGQGFSQVCFTPVSPCWARVQSKYSTNFLRDPVIGNAAPNGVFYVMSAWYATRVTRERVPGGTRPPEGHASSHKISPRRSMPPPPQDFTRRSMPPPTKIFPMRSMPPPTKISPRKSIPQEEHASSSTRFHPGGTCLLPQRLPQEEHSPGGACLLPQRLPQEEHSPGGACLLPQRLHPGGACLLPQCFTQEERASSHKIPPRRSMPPPTKFTSGRSIPPPQDSPPGGATLLHEVHFREEHPSSTRFTSGRSIRPPQDSPPGGASVLHEVHLRKEHPSSTRFTSGRSKASSTRLTSWRSKASSITFTSRRSKASSTILTSKKNKLPPQTSPPKEQDFFQELSTHEGVRSPPGTSPPT